MVQFAPRMVPGVGLVLGLCLKVFPFPSLSISVWFWPVVIRVPEVLTVGEFCVF